MKTSKRQKIFGILGNNLDHSLSPEIHNHLLRMYALDGIYTRFDVKKPGLAKAISGIRTLGIDGLNVTFPFKESVIKYIDRIDRSALETGAVNTIKNVKGVLIGFNTDPYGIKMVLSDQLKMQIRNKKICLVGAGGAARACVSVLLKNRPASILVLNRSTRKAGKMIRSFNAAIGKTEIAVKSLHRIPGLGQSVTFDLIINATSAGAVLTGKIMHSMERAGVLESTGFFDLNYGNRAFSKTLPKGIARYEDGLFMLVAQAVRSFQIWHGRKANISEIYKIMKR
ncbi:MAG: shikimate dehydrogenase [Candidatus Zixiibacteriota bacterium]|nr:MAG: shikimate dehydrogenase [candidate division Zixibacteria bacterium]